ncbi:winged helix DNA-binding domain-containing protein [Streptomyces justiciae]|uniref:winged helix DNA-binding domain-containing protein n=1 Tax=Streptomyces justiciae TaxID=2780140 RepID=UPI00187F86C5|nr:winged helix DNA-binding domain-containing protein [Streptomyces justiciae]MBE8477188.1 AlkZ family DNA glycosylase [Streptomyces justiciae]MCW8378744.1 winged helix DNA-binding domain-containing protein [Streptomyces justiciae]
MTSTSTITARELNRATLARQLLLRREPLGVADAVRRLLALQAQQPASPYLALWNRLDGFDPAELDAAFADRTLVKATLLRITLHTVHRDDYRTVREAMQPTLYASRLGYRFAAAGLTPADAAELEPGFLEFAAQPRSNSDLAGWLAERVGAEKKDGAWWGLRSYAPLVHVPTGGPWSFEYSPSYVAAPEGRFIDDPEAALRTLVLRYLNGFGPASAADIAQFAMVQRARVRAALKELGETLEVIAGPEGRTLYDVQGGPRPPADTPAPPRFLPMWDSVLLAYDDRSRVIPPEFRKLVTRVNGDVLPTLLVDGYVAGVWRPVEGGIEATAFHDLPDAVWDGLAEEARALLAFLADRDPSVYSRYAHWWTKLPAGQARVLPG